MEICKKICPECPFKKGAAPGWLGPYNGPEELHQIVMQEVPFVCHLRLDKDIDPNEAGTKKYPICRGSLAYMKKNAKLPVDENLKQAKDEIGFEEADQVMNLKEFMNHHNIEKNE